MVYRERRLTYRSSVLDRVFAPARTVAVAGPVIGLNEDRARAMLKIAGSAPNARIALVPSASSRRWDYQWPDLERVVSSLPDLDTSDLGRLLNAIRARPGERSPLEVIICGEYLVLDYSHGLGDGQFAVTLLSTLMKADVQSARSLVKQLPPHAISMALNRHFSSHPARVRDVLRVRRIHQAVPAERGGTQQLGDWRSATHSIANYMEPGTVAKLRAWASEHAVGSTSTSVTTALWMAALRGLGGSIDDRTVVLVNCRRYLPAEYVDSTGNFAVAIPLLLAASPDEIAGRVRQVTDSGWPLSILAVSELKDRLARLTDSRHLEQTPATNRIYLAISDIGRLTQLDDAPWVGGERPPQLAGYLEPNGPTALGLLVTELTGGRTFTASFSTEFADPSLIESALNRMCEDPVGVLRTAGI
jgi:hypothetical protein